MRLRFANFLLLSYNAISKFLISFQGIAEEKESNFTCFYPFANTSFLGSYGDSGVFGHRTILTVVCTELSSM